MNRKKLSTDCVTASSVNMLKNKVDTYLRRADYTDLKCFCQCCYGDKIKLHHVQSAIQTISPMFELQPIGRH